MLVRSHYEPRQFIPVTFWSLVNGMTSVAGAVVAAIIVGALYFGREVRTVGQICRQ
jgi:hypothetical protein